CSITSKSVICGAVGSSPISFSATTTCAELDTGSNSAKPCTMARTTILKIAMQSVYLSVSLARRMNARCVSIIETGAGDGRFMSIGAGGETMKIGFLGLGQMGAPMALRLLAAGHELIVWNRSESRADPLIHEGAILAGTPAEAELGADAVITMLFDDAAYERVVYGDNGLMDALSPGSIHISCS